MLRDSKKATPEQHDAFMRATENDCTETIKIEVQETGPGTASAGGCRGYWKTATYSAYLIPYLNNHVNIGLCFNYSNSVWRDWGPDCTVDGFLVFGGADQCFYRWNYNSILEFGDNFWASRFASPTIKKNGYDRWHSDAWGNVWHTEGGCCWP